MPHFDVIEVRCVSGILGYVRSLPGCIAGCVAGSISSSLGRIPGGIRVVPCSVPSRICRCSGSVPGVIRSRFCGIPRGIRAFVTCRLGCIAGRIGG
ncbi:hypothetical protein [Pseudomonas taiwanensis]|uniref:hypothetical protein n=1 Tax=Pseudomonas taiwanensis TaxID=470150 RepID=UPI0015BC167F|nr:hypothetical protein [Pseudomonas taiwanensis]